MITRLYSGILRSTIAVCCVSAALVGGTFAADQRAAPVVERQANLTTTVRQDEFPAIGCAADGRIWVAWVSCDGQKDGVVVRRLGDEAPSARIVLSGEADDCWRPAMERDGAGRLWVTWSQSDDRNWDIWGSYLATDEWSKPIRLTDNPENDICQQLVADANGQLWMAWQAVVEQNFEILVARVSPDGLEATQNVSRDPAGDWEPALAADSTGTVFIGWDSYRNGSYDILVSRLTEGKPSDPIQIAASPFYEAHASLAVDKLDRLWVAWDNGGPNWGRHGDARARLHSRRTVHVRCVDSGDVRALKQSVMSAFPEAMRKLCELPKLRVDGSGRLWLFVRHLQNLTPPGFRTVGGRKRPYQARGIWNPYAICCAGGTWSSPAKLPTSNGRNDMRTAICTDKSGDVWVAWPEDGRKPTRAEEPVNHNVHAARIRSGTAAQGGLGGMALAESASGATADVQPPPQPPRYELAVGDTSYRLMYGDTHRHTDISRCAMNYDGSLMDTYRYAIDVAKLDFLAISDHDQDLLKHRYSRDQQGPLQDYAWWRSQKYCDLFYIKDRFLPIYGYEHGGSYARRGGHKNILYAERGLPCYEEDSPEELFHVLRDKEAIAIPHQLADGGSATDWGKWNPHFERVAEIFQARGSYEYFGTPRQAAVERKGNYLQDALGSGVRIGVIASSDHGLVHGAYAGVYAREFTRCGVLEGLKARRSFGATDTMILDLRLGENVLGEEVEIDDEPTFQVFAQGMQKLKLVEIVRDGVIVYSTQPNASSTKFQFTDTDLKAGDGAYYYLRSQQDENDWAWSSAIWVRRRG